MATKIYTAKVLVGNRLIECMVVKKLPSHLLIDSHFITKLKRAIGDSGWKELKKDKITKLPLIEIDFIKQIGTVNEEPIIENYHGY